MPQGFINTLLGGRLGNQFFNYAFARALQLKFYPDYKLIFNVREFSKVSREKNEQGWRNQLVDYKIDGIEFIDTNEKYRPSIFFRAPVKFVRLFYKIFGNEPDDIVKAKFWDKGGFYTRSESYYYPLYVSASKQIKCIGNFENYNYFHEFRDLFLKEFTPKYDVLERNINFMNDIQNSQSVCVTIRRGNFLDSEIRDRFDVCSPEYFCEGMKRMRAQIPECKFFIFTDDVEDVRKNFKFPYDVTFESGNDPVWEKLRLMYSCKHFVISNSTFSWWAQYLSQNPNKIVYAPDPWRNEEGVDFSGMYLPYMQKIKCV